MRKFTTTYTPPYLNTRTALCGVTLRDSTGGTPLQTSHSLQGDTMDKTTNILSFFFFSLLCACSLMFTSTAHADVEGDPVYLSVTAKVSEGRLQQVSILDSNLHNSQALQWFQENISQELGNHITMRFLAAPLLNHSPNEIPVNLQLRDTLVVGLFNKGNLTATAINMNKVSGFGSGQAYEQQPGNGEVGNPGQVGFENQVPEKTRVTPQWSATQPTRKGSDLTELY